MLFTADFHIHSRYSRATSKNLDLESLYQWAGIKGLNVIGTGDFTHPVWIRELESKLEPDGNGLFRLKEPPAEPGLPGIKTKGTDVRFCLTTEISSIYKYDGRVRKNHNLVLAPDIATARKINTRLGAIGNITSDGRPILGISARDLLEIVIETSDDAHLIPAHIWTPWFSTLGSKAGYDSVEECFRDLSDHIFALETGLSSDPAMNWKVSSLDRYTLVSNSDAHSPQKLGREANLFDTDLSYYSIIEALKTKEGFNGTYEFFPEEGKYHLDGHRKCDVCMEPRDSVMCGGVCPVCGKPLTIGVLNRVEKLADRKAGLQPPDAPGFKYIIPLPEILAEFMGSSPDTKSVRQLFAQAISCYGNEFDLLHNVPIDDIRPKSGSLLAEAIRRLRNREVHPVGGYDGEYGVISVFKPGEIEEFSGQRDLFGGDCSRVPQKRKTIKMESVLLEPAKNLQSGPEINEEQLLAIRHEGNAVVIAGPGTGKTYTLVQWIVYQVEKKNRAPESIIAITFTNKAADELRERLDKHIGEKAGRIMSGTFHAVAYSFLREMDPGVSTIYDAINRRHVFSILFPDLTKIAINDLSNGYESFFEGTKAGNDTDIQFIMDKYHAYLDEHNAVDLSSILWRTNVLLEKKHVVITERYSCIAIDEFQDINTEQYRFVKLLSGNKRVFAIGDPNQSVYGFRGSDINLFFNSVTDLGASEVRLKKNYRTPPMIMEAANTLISHNGMKAEESQEAIKSSDTHVRIYAAGDALREAKYIAEKIQYYIGGTETTTTGEVLSDFNYAFSDIAVLYRTRYAGREIARMLKQAGIPVALSDGTSYLSVPPFDVISCAMRLLENRGNIVALAGLLETVGDIAAKDIPFLLRGYLNNDFTLERIIANDAWRRWMVLYSELYPGFKTGDTGELLQRLLDFFLPESELDEEEWIKREMLLKSARERNDGPVDFLRKNILSPYTDVARQKNAGVRLMTFHASKGLEFPVVFIAAAEEGITPVLKEDTDIEEERRLFYVAMTRAMEILHISYANNRRMFGEDKETQMSRFIDEMGGRTENDKPKPMRKQQSTDQQLQLF